MFKIIKYSNREEWANAITHGIAVIMSYFGLILLWIKSISRGDFVQLTTAIVFGVAAILLFTASTVYHILRKGKWKHIFQIVDHIAIYILIAGTYTPITLVLMKDFDGIYIFYLVWVVSIAGIIYKLFFFEKYKLVSVVFYIGLGWTVLIKLDVLLFSMPPEITYWLLLGGIFYTMGVLFFLWEKLKFSHAIWHMFVIAGCSCHYYLVYNYVIP